MGLRMLETIGLVIQCIGKDLKNKDEEDGEVDGICFFFTTVSTERGNEKELEMVSWRDVLLTRFPFTEPLSILSAMRPIRLLFYCFYCSSTSFSSSFAEKRRKLKNK